MLRDAVGGGEAWLADKGIWKQNRHDHIYIYMHIIYIYISVWNPILEQGYVLYVIN